MKRKGLVVLLVISIMVFSTSTLFAATGELEIESIYPEDGQTNTSMENVGVKIQFSTAISTETAEANLEEGFLSIIDEDGIEVPLKVVADGEGELLVLADTTTDDEYSVLNNADYTFTIYAGFTDDEGNTLTDDYSVTFTTLNQSLNSTIYMILMFIMFAFVMVASVKQTQEQTNAANAKEKEQKEIPFNPYKEAKKTGKTVEEVIAAEEARKEKERKKMSRSQKKEAELKEKMEQSIVISEELSYVHHVKTPARISKAGGKFKSGLGKKPEEKNKNKKKASSGGGGKKN